MIRLVDLLKEIGEGTAKPYDYKLVADVSGDAIYYTFTTDPNPDKAFTVNGITHLSPGTDYEVDLRYWDLEKNVRSSTNLDVAFSTHGGEYEEETNDNMQYRIMATVVAIVKEALSKHPEVTTLSFTPAKADKMDARRTRFYKAYMQKQIPNSTVTELKGDGFKVTLKSNN